MRHVLILILLCLPGLDLSAQFSGDLLKVDSRSGQFQIVGPPVPLEKMGINAQGRMRLEPGLLAVSCERLKEALLAELGISERILQLPAARGVGGKMYLIVQERADAPISVAPIKTAHGWNYRVHLPSEIEPRILIDVLVQLLLLERADRQSDGSRPIEFPAWLLEGLSAHMTAMTLDLFELRPNQPFFRNEIRPDPVVLVRAALKDKPPLTFEELSWPGELNEAQVEVYRACSHLFVYQLLRLKNGPASMLRLVEELPRYRNWQFAFLAAFGAQFSKLIDVEKWWALSLVEFTGRDPSQLWSMKESWQRFETALQIPVQLRTTPFASPERNDLPLQEVIEDWDATRQQLALHKTIQQLRALRYRVQPELLSLVDDYRGTLERYLLPRTSPGRQQVQASQRQLRRAAIRELDELDEVRAELRRRQLAVEEKAAELGAAQP